MHLLLASKYIRRRGLVIPGLMILFCLPLILSISCHYYSLEQKLNPENAEWLDKVRYIITSKERKMFLELPATEKEEFKEEFWARRDPDPQTEENEFEMEYYNRIERADELFISEGRPGWLTDRGRIYVLFGPPMDRITNNPSYNCSETWYYGNFPVVFVDSSCSGNYRLVTYNLTQLRTTNLMYMQQLSRAQSEAQQTIQGQEGFFNFNWKVKAALVGGERVEGIIFMEVPFSHLWLKEKDGEMVTVLELYLEVKDTDKKKIWEYEESYEVKTTEEELQESKGTKYKIELPFVIEKNVDLLRKGRNKIFATLKNTTGNKTVRKVLGFEFKN